MQLSSLVEDMSGACFGTLVCLYIYYYTCWFVCIYTCTCTCESIVENSIITTYFFEPFCLVVFEVYSRNNLFSDELAREKIIKFL